MPLKLEEFEIGQRWSIAEAMRLNTGGGVGAEIVKNETFEIPEHNMRNFVWHLPHYDGDSSKSQRTKNNSKRFGAVKNFIFRSNNHDSSENNQEEGPSVSQSDAFRRYSPKQCQYICKLHKVAGLLPWYLQKFAPKDALCFHEQTWFLYPIVRTHIANDFVKDKLCVRITTVVEEYRNNQFNENAHALTAEQLDKREIIFIDISKASSANIKSDDPRRFRSTLTDRGPLADNWWSEPNLPVICVYIRLDCEFQWFGLQTKVESTMVNIYRKTFTKIHSETFCWIDKWFNLTKEEVKRFETELQDILTTQINSGEIVAPKFEND